MDPYPVPAGRTARRLIWRHLPPHVRSLVEQRCGSAVVAARSCDAGFTPGFASVLECQDGSRHFVKAASVRAQDFIAASYREEARKLGPLPGSVPAPRLRWVHDDDDWVVLGLEYVEGRNPARPWRVRDLDATLDSLELVAQELTPPPRGLALDPIEVAFATWPGYWDHVRATRPDLHPLEEAAGLAARFAEVTPGNTLVHTDVRDDNVILGRAGRVWICDWNWPVSGAAWLDSLFALVGPRGDGLDVESVLATRPLLREVPTEHVDITLALLVGFFFQQGGQPVPPASPYLRAHQLWQGDVCWEWLCERRGWN